MNTFITAQHTVLPNIKKVIYSENARDEYAELMHLGYENISVDPHVPLINKTWCGDLPAHEESIKTHGHCDRCQANNIS